jgi:hypothetical protein
MDIPCIEMAAIDLSYGRISPSLTLLLADKLQLGWICKSSNVIPEVTAGNPPVLP